ncbi:putative ATP binding protein [Corchorus olitorius]|uniref:ATP binding protein n=1 Tax=Corchorus olitorius TaxID=93759 RepID=A0A1R3L1V6_9ROSI|nr:putative ATP binding protein [Corchorus olitorius]OMP13343.1 putative ATP binding protein [Corchorus olitorius]
MVEGSRLRTVCKVRAEGANRDEEGSTSSPVMRKYHPFGVLSPSSETLTAAYLIAPPRNQFISSARFANP